ncbi:hypothetical protein ACTXT7_015990 [Hymenolepis weldensis]
MAAQTCAPNRHTATASTITDRYKCGRASPRPLSTRTHAYPCADGRNSLAKKSSNRFDEIDGQVTTVQILTV